ncbi:unnamed protein product [Eretmochelys imbricata]
MSSMVDVKTLYENLLNLNLSEEGDAPAGSEPRGGSGDSHVWPLRTVWSPSVEQVLSPPEPAAPRPSFRTDRSLSLIEGRTLPPPPARLPPAAAPAGPRPLGPLQDGALPHLQRDGPLPVRGQMPVRPRGRGAADPQPPPQVQDGAVPQILPPWRMPLRLPLPLRSLPGRAGAGCFPAASAPESQLHRGACWPPGLPAARHLRPGLFRPGALHLPASCR